MKKVSMWKIGIAICMALMLGVGVTMAQQTQGEILTEVIENQCRPCGGFAAADGPDICDMISYAAPIVLDQLESGTHFTQQRPIHDEAEQYEGSEPQVFGEGRSIVTITETLGNGRSSPTPFGSLDYFSDGPFEFEHQEDDIQIFPPIFPPTWLLTERAEYLLDWCELSEDLPGWWGDTEEEREGYKNMLICLGAELYAAGLAYELVSLIVLNVAMGIGFIMILIGLGITGILYEVAVAVYNLCMEILGGF